MSVTINIFIDKDGDLRSVRTGKKIEECNVPPPPPPPKKCNCQAVSHSIFFI